MTAGLLLIRHGETACSRQGRFCGACDQPLTAAGVQAVRALAGRLAHLLAGQARALLTSPATRATQTAELLSARLGLPYGLDGRLAEMRFGAWEGRQISSLAGVTGYESWVADPVLFAPPGGEPGAAVLARALAAVRELAERHPDGLALVVSHKHLIRLVVAHARGLPLRGYRSSVAVPHASVTVLRFDSRGLAVAAAPESGDPGTGAAITELSHRPRGAGHDIGG
jgi:probable phosphoglycerate mutase